METELIHEPMIATKVPWNKGKMIGSKPPLRIKNVWSIRTKLQVDGRLRDLAMFNLAIDSKLRGCDVVTLRVEDIVPHGAALDRATVRQKKTGHPVRFELTEQTRKQPGDYLFPSRRFPGRPLTTRQYARLVSGWIAGIGLDASFYGTHSLRRPRPPSSTGEPAISGRCSSCWATGRSRARSAISGSRSMTHSLSPSRWTSELPGQSGPALASS
jgi:hypothetical protein